MRRDVRTGLLIGAAISAGLAGLLLTRGHSGLGIAEPPSPDSQARSMDVAPAVEPSRGAGAALPPAPQPPAAPAEQVRSGQETSAALKPVKATRFHIVREGETLSSIAARYYGNAAAVRKLIEANRETVKDPDRIRPGIKIIIPD